MNKAKHNSEIIFNYINAPEKIISIEHINKLIADKSCLTLIEKPFFIDIKKVIKEINDNNIVGDIVIIGVFKGGAALYTKALFDELGDSRKIWLFDSFKGFNRKNLNYERDINSLALFGSDDLFEKAASAKNVKQLFEKYELHKDMELIEGYIEQTLLNTNTASIAYLHIDVDCYDPTLYALEKLYSKISLGGWCILDDYDVSIFGCKDATDYFRLKNNINSAIVKFGRYPAGWKKTYL